MGENISFGKLNALLEDIASNYKNVGDTICDKWSSFNTVIRREWIGPAQVDAQNKLGHNLRYIYGLCKEVVDDVINQLVAIGEQKRQNEINHSDGEYMPPEVIKPALVDADVRGVVKNVDQNWDEDTFIGLQSDQAASNIDAALNDIVDSVYNKVSEFYENIQIGDIIRGSETAAIKQYISDIGTALSKLTTCQKTVKESLDAATESYKLNSEEARDVMSKIDVNSNINLNGENLR